MTTKLETLDDLIELTKAAPPVRVGIVCAEQREVLETVHDAQARGLIRPLLIGDPDAIAEKAREIGFEIDPDAVVAAWSEEQAAATGAGLLGGGGVDTLMKGFIHTDVFMKALLSSSANLRVPGRRVSHVFIADIPAYPRLLAITDAAVNIAPDLTAKAQILQNAIDVMRSLGIERPKAAILSAVETVNVLIESTTDAAALSVMARRGQIKGAEVDGPLAFDNAVSMKAAEVKGIASPVAGAADIVLTPDLVSGNILAKNLEYLAGATLAGLVVGLKAPIVLSSRADPPAARLAALALARKLAPPEPEYQLRPALDHTDDALDGCCAPMPEEACFPKAGA
ncbi:bifunctional enoyl-CoA hydratase/phosphate acetyltransferase [Hyphococcus sp.]|jgi:phosphotransacetylase|uniref:bifunctional enoyl-CoA hydratase/phosphate acetyltransferase n=1 Tax=Hyphococcus sp. TaxID=2038636 RepID=UPI003D0FB559